MDSLLQDDPGGRCTAILDPGTGRRWAPNDPAAPTEPVEGKTYIGVDLDAV